MTIYEVNKILSSENKSRIITHFFNCTCSSHDVNNMCFKLKASQPNTSKHFAKLLNLGVLDVNNIGSKRYYSINKVWKKEWAHIVEPQLKDKNNVDFICSCISK